MFSTSILFIDKTVWTLRRKFLALFWKQTNSCFLFLVVLKMNETSSETNIYKIIENDPTNYQAWHTLKETLLTTDNLGLELQTQLRQTKNVLRNSPKVYQAWQHLKFLHKAFGVPFEHTQLVTDLFLEDERNYNLFEFLTWAARISRKHLVVVNSLAKKFSVLSKTRYNPSLACLLSFTEKESWAVLINCCFYYICRR